MLKFDRGRMFERLFKDRFPDAIDVSAVLHSNFSAYPDYTAEILAREGEVHLFEAGFRYDDVLVLADVVRKCADGTLDIYEVKSGFSLSDTYISDAALQHYVISHCFPVSSFSVVYNGVTDMATLSSQSDTPCNFMTVNLTDELQSRHAMVSNNISCMKEVLKHAEPDITPGDRCLSPYECPYLSYCNKGLRHLSLF